MGGAHPTEPIPIFPWIGALTMKQRLALGSAAAVFVVAVTVMWIALAPRAAYAMDGLAQSIRQAKSYEYTMTMEMSMAREPGKDPVKVEMKGKFSWLAPGSYRIEIHRRQRHAGAGFPDDSPGG